MLREEGGCSPGAGKTTGDPESRLPPVEAVWERPSPRGPNEDQRYCGWVRSGSGSKRPTQVLNLALTRTDRGDTSSLCSSAPLLIKCPPPRRGGNGGDRMDRAAKTSRISDSLTRSHHSTLSRGTTCSGLQPPDWGRTTQPRGQLSATLTPARGLSCLIGHSPEWWNQALPPC